MGRAAPLVTKSLLFIADGAPRMVGMPSEGWDWAGGSGFRAFDKKTGDVVWQMELSHGATGAPMTYLHEGRQYIVLPLGGVDQKSELVALALPRDES
jgi:glucose dehydrogenase